MSIEVLTEQTQFISAIEPFQHLSKGELSQLVRQFQIEYHREGTALEQVIHNRLILIKKGAIAYYSPGGQLLNQYHEGELCSLFISPDELFAIEAITIEDALLYTISASALYDVCEATPEIKTFFSQTAAQKLQTRLKKKRDEAILSAQLLQPKVREHCSESLTSVDCALTIKETAIRMTETGHSSLVVTQMGAAIGIVTDKDIRKKCVAQGLSFDQSVSQIMSTPLITIDKTSDVQDALLLMTNKEIHHLAVTEHDKVVGVLSATDIMQLEQQNSSSLVQQINRATTIQDLANLAKRLPQLQVKLTELSHQGGYVAKQLSTIAKALTIRIIKLIQNEIGPAPVPFAWLAAGSLARSEQLAFSDQDNALIFDDAATSADLAYFARLAQRVCDALHLCGFVYCPGDIMATNPNWRLKQKQWRRLFNDWITEPTPKALLNGSVFFDLETVYGDQTLLFEVRSEMLKLTKNNSLFIAQLSKNALNTRVPLGLFRDFVLTPDGNNEKVLDLKHSALALLVDLARIYALSQGIDAVNTIERLRLSGKTPALTEQSSLSAIDAFEFLSLLRLEQQVWQIKNKVEVNNNLKPKTLSPLERSHLKQAFKIVQGLQDSRQVTY